jgi:hypothetical protein
MPDYIAEYVGEIGIRYRMYCEYDWYYIEELELNSSWTKRAMYPASLIEKCELSLTGVIAKLSKVWESKNLYSPSSGKEKLAIAMPVNAAPSQNLKKSRKQLRLVLEGYTLYL